MSARVGAAMDGALVQQMIHGVETIAGVVSDVAFGSVVMFGSGGTAVELFGDRGLPHPSVHGR
jgi:acyl-CoA synthetase (NDP forming)